MHKRCGECRKIKDVFYFSKSRTDHSKDGYKSVCDKCLTSTKAILEPKRRQWAAKCLKCGNKTLVQVNIRLCDACRYANTNIDPGLGFFYE